MSSEDGLSPEQTAEHVRLARARLQAVRDESSIPVIAHAAHQADLYCHRILWELGVEDGTTPELEERIELGGTE